ncbi:hypothetical protein [Streptomyces olivaceoviridis]
MISLSIAYSMSAMVGAGPKRAAATGPHAISRSAAAPRVPSTGSMTRT